jgi:hypothetical protein
MTLRDVFLEQARSCATMGSPFIGQLMTMLATAPSVVLSEMRFPTPSNRCVFVPQAPVADTKRLAAE